MKIITEMKQNMYVHNLMRPWALSSSIASYVRRTSPPDGLWIKYRSM